MLRRSHTSAPATVQSFLVQAEQVAALTPRSRKSTLVRHLLARFQADDNGDDEQTVRRTLFLCATAALPGFFVSILLYPVYQPIAMPPPHRPYWSQAGDEYLFLLYSFVVMGIAAIMQWETIFPDLLDVFALAPLPLPGKLLLQARWLALIILFGGALLCANAAGILIFPAVVDAPNVLRHYAAHGIGTLAAGFLACTFLIAVQSLLEIALGARLAKATAPLLQTACLLALFVLAGFSPAAMAHLQQGVTTHAGAAGLNPVVWLLGTYEQLRGAEEAQSAWSALAWRGWLATAMCGLAAAVLYPIAYSRRMLYLVESGNAAFPPHRMPRRFVQALHASLLRRPDHRAAFHLVAQTLFRASKLRTTMTLYLGLGLAFVLGTSLHHPVRAAAIIACAFALGVVSVTRQPFMLKASWIFSLTGARQDEQRSEGGLRFAILWGTVTTVAAVAALLALFQPAGTVTWRVILITLTAAMTTAGIVATAMMTGVRASPFTEEQQSTPERFVFAFLRSVVVLPLTLVAFGWLATRAAQAASTTLLFVAGLVLAFCSVRRISRFCEGLVRNGWSPD